MDVRVNQEIWQVETNGHIHDTNFAEMTSRIDNGSLHRTDLVRKGNLRWIEAGKVPSLLEFFNAKDTAAPPEPVITTTHTEVLGVSEPPASAGGLNAVVNPTFGQTNNINEPQSAADVCAMHPDIAASYICNTCTNLFCKACPNSYGGTVKICPFCGAMCSSLEKVVEAKAESSQYSAAVSSGFGFADFGRAIAYPFKFKTSLVLGAIMFMFFSIGQSAMSFGGIFMFSSVIFCALLANTLTFGVLANTVENFSQGKIGLNFMPTFEDFSLWDDVVHPFFLSIGVYISSFGPLIAVGLIAFFMVVGTVNKEMNGLQSDAARTINPELPYAANAVKQSEKVKELLKSTQENQKKRVESLKKGVIEPNATFPANAPINSEEQDFERINKMISDQRKAQLESAVGKTPETVANERAELLKQILGYGTVFIIIGGVCLLWGLFYFPAACAVAGYTRSFTATLNPSVGIDTIRRLGGDYVKILLMGLSIVLMSGIIGSVLNLIFSSFDMPGVGNVPARAIGSLFGFYFSVVFSCVIGFALYKASNKLKLYR